MMHNRLEAHAIRASIDEIFEQRVRDAVSPGSFVALFGAEGIEYERGFGQRKLDGGAPNGQTAFRIASCTKSFTAAVVLLLRDRGQLNLDAPITDFVPAFRPSLPTADPVTPTVRMLLTMSGGLPTDDPWGDRQESLTHAQLTRILAAGTPLTSVPGTSFEYSNLGYALLGQVIDAVTGRPYIDVVSTELLEPLELTDTGFSRPLTPDANIAIGYRKAHDGWRELPFSSPGAFSPIGGIFTTAHDLAQWARWLASALTPDAAQPGPLSAASRREMQQINRFIPIAPTPASGEPASVRGYGYGFGLFVETDSRLGHTVFHSGGYPGFSAHMRWNQPCGIGIVAFENATYAGVSAAAAQALDLAIDHVGAAALPPAPWAATTAMKPRVESLLHGWDDALADEIFAENVALDVPYAERAAAIRTVLQCVGGLEDAAPPQEPHADSAAHLVWYLPARNGRVRVEIRLTPTTPALIQTLKVDADTTA